MTIFKNNLVVGEGGRKGEIFVLSPCPCIIVYLDGQRAFGECMVYIGIWDYPVVSHIIHLGAHFCLNLFIYVSSLHVLGIQVPIVRKKSLYLCDTGICHSGWVAFGRLVGLKFQVTIQPADQTPPIQNDKCRCHIGTVIFS